MLCPAPMLCDATWPSKDWSSVIIAFEPPIDSPALAKAFWAPSIDFPIRLGTVEYLISGPLLTTKLISAPSSTSASTSGVWLIIFPAATLSLNSYLTFPNFNFLSCIVF